MEVPEDPDAATMVFHGRAYEEVEKDARARGADIFDFAKVAQEHPFHAVEFMFPHYFLLPMMAAMSSYRIRPLTEETCLFEIWSLVIRPDSEEYETPLQPTMIPYNSDLFPEIPRQDYSNLPIQQLTGSFIAGGAITGTGAWESCVMHIRCKASTAITIGTTAGTFTGVTYTAEGIIKQVN